MWHQSSKLERANVVAAFDNQDDSEDALLGLRVAGFRDNRIGYYYPSGKGQMRDHLAHYHRFAAAAIGGIIGAGAGLLFARWSFMAGQHLDPVGLALTCAVCGALFLGMAGGMMGMWSARTGEAAPVMIDTTEPFVLAVVAGDAREEASAIIRQHGGHELQTLHSPAPALAN